MGARGTGCWGATCFVAARARKRREMGRAIKQDHVVKRQKRFKRFAEEFCKRIRQCRRRARAGIPFFFETQFAQA